MFKPKCRRCKTFLNKELVSDKIAKYLYIKDLEIKCKHCGSRYRIDIEFHFMLSLFIASLTSYGVYTALTYITPTLIEKLLFIPTFIGSSLLFYLLGVNGSLIATYEYWKD